MTFAQCMAELSQALGRPVKYTRISVDDYIHVLAEQGVPGEMQWLLRELFTEVLDGRNSDLVSGVEEALGRPATDFKEYLHRTLKTGVWALAAERKSA